MVGDRTAHLTHLLQEGSGEEVGLTVLKQLEATASYTGLLLAPMEGFGQSCSCPLGKKRIVMLFMSILVICLCSVVTLDNLEIIPLPLKSYKKSKSENKK